MPGILEQRNVECGEKREIQQQEFGVHISPQSSALKPLQISASFNLQNLCGKKEDLWI